MNVSIHESVSILKSDTGEFNIFTFLKNNINRQRSYKKKTRGCNIDTLNCTLMDHGSGQGFLIRCNGYQLFKMDVLV